MLAKTLEQSIVLGVTKTKEIPHKEQALVLIERRRDSFDEEYFYFAFPFDTRAVEVSFEVNERIIIHGPKPGELSVFCIFQKKHGEWIYRSGVALSVSEGEPVQGRSVCEGYIDRGKQLLDEVLDKKNISPTD